MMVALNLFRFLGDTLLIVKPALGYEIFGILSPECIRKIDGTKRDVDSCPFGDCYAFQTFAGFANDG